VTSAPRRNNGDKTMAQIQVYTGFGYAGHDDIARAKEAAKRVLGGLAIESYTAYQDQSAADIDIDDMTGLAALFVEATRAADLALTDGWHDRNADWCRLEVYQDF